MSPVRRFRAWLLFRRMLAREVEAAGAQNYRMSAARYRLVVRQCRARAGLPPRR